MASPFSSPEIQRPSRGKGLSIASLVLGLAGAGLPALICGTIALGRKDPGKGMAIAGTVLGAVSTAVVLILAVALLAASRRAPSEWAPEPARYAHLCTHRLEALSERAAELRGDGTMASNLARFDSVYALTQASVAEVRRTRGEAVDEARVVEISGMFHVMERLLEPDSSGSQHETGEDWKHHGCEPMKDTSSPPRPQP